MIRRGMVAVVAVALCGCGGGREDEHLFARADAVRIADVQPAAPGWTWPQTSNRPVWSGGSESGAATDPLLVEFRRRTADLTTLGDAGKRWQDGAKLANLDVAVFGSGSDAHQALPAFNALSRGFARRTGRIVSDEDVDGLGDEAWRLRVEGNGPEVTYHWRRDNLLIEAHVHCFGPCPRDFDAVARRWAETVDTASRR